MAAGAYGKSCLKGSPPQLYNIVGHFLVCLTQPLSGNIAYEQSRPESFRQDIDSIINDASSLSDRDEMRPPSRVAFNPQAQTYLFRRANGTCVIPEYGTVTLGMEQRHEAVIAEKLTDLTLSPRAGKFKSLEEKARNQLLEALNVRFERGSAKEIENRQKTLKKYGCSCVGWCRPKRCECIRNGIPCQVDHGKSCNCDAEKCSNPERHEFDKERMIACRRERIRQINALPSPK